VRSIVTRYSSIFPFATLAFRSTTCRPVIPLAVRLALEALADGVVEALGG
jgi:hypothetical protein